MNPDQFQSFFIQIAVMLAVAWLFGYLMKRLAQPIVLGEIIGGIVLGPTLLGSFCPDVYAMLFPDDKAIVTGMAALLKIGLLFFMFAAGLEVNLVHFRQSKKLIAMTSFCGGMLPFALGFVMVMLFPTFWGQTDRLFLFALFMGTALSISALPVIARILMEMDLIGSRIGMTVMTSAMVTDWFGWILFAFLLRQLGHGDAEEGVVTTLVLVLGYTVVVLGIGRWIVLPVMNNSRLFKDWPGGLLSFVALLIMLAAVGAEKVGIHAFFGAFLVGMAFSQGHDPEQEKTINSMIQPFALTFFAPLYFVSVGLKANFSSQLDVTLCSLIFFVACFGKIVGAGLGARFGGMQWREALAVGVGLNARGAVEIILASIALEYHLIDQRIFVALVLMAFLTTLLSSVVLKYLLK
ncbi:Kef-type K+ transport system, putative NAD-binding component [Methyloglobulus morosus KoM1]|uniref:Kef-type K+ transport system, putative NAD-binding component n=1 Tax=Methyloglobulus morosus KoM1 TaxID=1116472 RepID=V5E1P1_9GAMM|nr:cation:proton antiporter [Methyloglobulus morosus]ESS73476.1 Kef-type K+ transport system, putative NAD-binding component [Methyloglobulus morosus KoM1]